MSKRTEELVKWEREHIVSSMIPVGKSRGIIFDKAKGVILQDTEGNQYIDGASQLVCVNLGYGQHEIIDAIKAQLEKLQYGTLYFGFGNTASIEYSQKLAELTPEGLTHFVFSCGGSESTEIAIRIARLYHALRGTRKYKIFSLADSYHGVTSDVGTVTGVGKGFFERGGVPIAGHIHIPSYFCYRCMLGKEYPSCGVDCARFLDEAIEKEGPGTVAAFIAEPEMGVAGFIPPPPEYWPMVRKICDDRDVLLIADEVMTGFCRTGKMFGVQNWNVKPDIMSMAKGISSSYIPFGAVAFNDRIYDVFSTEGAAFAAFTFGGHPVGAAASTAALKIYARDKVAEHVREVGQYAVERLNADFKPLPCVDNIGGLGLMIGMNIVADKETKRPFELSQNVMGKIQDEALEKGLWIRVCHHGATPSDRVMFGPPLIITKVEVDRALDILYPIVASIKPS